MNDMGNGAPPAGDMVFAIGPDEQPSFSKRGGKRFRFFGWLDFC